MKTPTKKTLSRSLTIIPNSRQKKTHTGRPLLRCLLPNVFMRLLSMSVIHASSIHHFCFPSVNVGLQLKECAAVKLNRHSRIVIGIVSRQFLKLAIQGFVVTGVSRVFLMQPYALNSRYVMMAVML